jgi:hypothetical protein
MNVERLVGAEEMRVNEGAIWFAPFLFAGILRPNSACEAENRQSSPSAGVSSPRDRLLGNSESLS